MSLQWDVGYIVRKRAEMSPDKAAIIFEDEPVTYKALNEGANRAAHLLRKRGIRNGDRVSVVLLNCVEFLEVYFACAKLGAILVPLNFRLVGRELEYQLNDSAARMVLFHDAFVDNLDEIRSRLKVEADKFIFMRSGSLPADGSEGTRCPPWAVDYHELRDDQPTGEPHPERPVEFNDPLAIVYTSGVTGNPKGAVLTHKQTYFKNFQVAFYTEARPDDIFVAQMPLHRGHPDLVCRNDDDNAPWIQPGRVCRGHRAVPGHGRPGPDNNVADDPRDGKVGRDRYKQCSVRLRRGGEDPSEPVRGIWKAGPSNAAGPGSDRELLDDDAAAGGCAAEDGLYRKAGVLHGRLDCHARRREGAAGGDRGDHGQGPHGHERVLEPAGDDEEDDR